MNHSENLMDPATDAHTNLIEGTWTHAKYKSLWKDLSEFMWTRPKGLTSSCVYHVSNLFKKFD
jgi:hypothetical protein